MIPGQHRKAVHTKKHIQAEKENDGDGKDRIYYEENNDFHKSGKSTG
jgi:hypothetical protein